MIFDLVPYLSGLGALSPSAALPSRPDHQSQPFDDLSEQGQTYIQR
jgi:hypothetical protein